MNKTLNFLVIPTIVSPLATAIAVPGEWYLGGSVVYTDDDPGRRLNPCRALPERRVCARGTNWLFRDGCIQDQDGDGVTDDIDECPNTVSGAAIHVNGCERDDDGDNVVNHLDDCLNTRANAPVDARGCEIRSTVELRGVTFASSPIAC